MKSKTPFAFLQAIICGFIGEETTKKAENSLKNFLYAFSGKTKKEIELKEEIEKQKIILEAQEKAKQALGLGR